MRWAQQFEWDCDHLLPKAIAPIELELGLVGNIKVFSSSSFFWMPTHWAILLIASLWLTNKKSKQNNLLHFLILFRKMIIYLIWKLRETIYVGNTFLFSSVHTPGLISRITTAKLIHLFAREVLLLKKLEIEATKTA